MSGSVLTSQPFVFMPEQGAAPIAAAGTTDACSLYFDGTDLLLSRNGGAYAAVAVGATGVTLDGAYDFGGAGVGRAITADAGAVTITNNAANNTNLLEITKAPTGAQSGFGVVVTMGANVTSAAAAAVFDFRGTAGTAAGNGIVNVEVGAATVLTGPLAGVVVDLSTNVTPGANAVTGVSVSIPGSSSAATAGVRVSSVQTGVDSSGLVVEVTPAAPAQVRGAFISAGANVTGQGLVVEHNGSAASLTCVAVRVTGSQQASGIEFDDGQFVNVSNANEGRLIYSAATGTFRVSQNGSAFSDLAVAGSVSLQTAYDAGPNVTVSVATGTVAWTSSMNTGNAFLISSGAVVLVGGLLGLGVTLDAVIPGAFQVTGIRVTIPATTVALSNDDAVGLHIDSKATLAAVATIQARNTGVNGGIVQINYGPGAAVTLNSRTTALRIDMFTRVNPAAGGGVPIVCLHLIGAATGRASTNTEGLVYVENYAVLARSIDCEIANQGGEVFWIRYRSNTTFTATLQGLRIDLARDGGNGGGAQTVIGNSVYLPANCASGSIFFQADATYATSGSMFHSSVGSSHSLTGVTYGVRIAHSLLNGGTQIYRGFYVETPSNINASDSSVFTGLWTSVAGSSAMLLIGPAVNGTSTGTTVIAQLASMVASYTLGASLTGLVVNLTTNVVPGSQVVTGVSIAIPATTAATGGAISIQSLATAAPIFSALVVNTSGTLFSIGYSAATTPTSAITAMRLDLDTAVNANTQANIGLDIPINASDEDTTAPLRLNAMRIFVGTGLPNNAEGSDGDVYHRKDGGVGSSIFKKWTGAWYAIA